MAQVIDNGLSDVLERTRNTEMFTVSSNIFQKILELNVASELGFDNDGESFLFAKKSFEYEGISFSEGCVIVKEDSTLSLEDLPDIEDLIEIALGQESEEELKEDFEF